MLKVLEIEPQDIKNAVSIIEADVNVEFAAPVGYVEPTPTTSQSQKTSTQTEDPDDLDPSQVVDSDEEDKPKPNEFKPFTGQGSKISGKPLTTTLTFPQKPTEEKKSLEEKKPFLIKGLIQYLTQSELDAIKQKQQSLPSQPSQTAPQTTQKPSSEQKPPSSHTTSQKPSSEQKPASSSDQKPPSYFSGKGYSLK